jgi:NADP-dependent 3-hydroxy acid dehydrogenase YdfG
MALPGISRFGGKLALVTGASVGIGAAIADSLVKHGLTVVGCARNPQPIEVHAQTLAKIGSYTGKLVSYKCDLAKEEEVEEMFKWIEEKHGGVDICINNAGMAVNEPLLESDAKKLRGMLDLNFIALVMCTKLSVKSMRARGIEEGHIININSVLGHQTRYLLQSYTASKFAVRALTEGFRKEIHEAGLNIRVSSISPGMVQTHFLYEHMGRESAEQLYSSVPNIKAEDVSNAVLYVISQPANVQVQDILLEATKVKPT